MSDAKRFGLPENQSAEETADALEASAAGIRKSENHERGLLEAIESQAASKRDGGLLRALGLATGLLS